ncbi:hypothetical protein [Actinomadura roseirufa]|uniref:hypothetical protein n=1 Tax=Actinomadura roseirufa TaxID=2094049 RepID=UPI001041326D|nr:hypothetical protein [Actinomadura roseirufa]
MSVDLTMLDRTGKPATVADLAYLTETTTGTSRGLIVYGAADLALDGDATRSPYLYHSVGTIHDRLPNDLSFRIPTADQAQADTQYAGSAPPAASAPKPE